MLDNLIKQNVVELHFYRENMVINQESQATSIIQWDYAVLGAKSYVLNLSQNVKRSLEYKRKNGEWDGAAPLGYLNTRDLITKKATLELDKSRAFLIKRIFEDYATGLYSINEMAKRAKEWGLHGQRQLQKPLAPS